MQRKYLPALLVIPALILAFSSAGQAAAEPRNALVIGNSDYINTPLRNPAHDAEDMAAALTKLGFTVIKQVNVSRVQFRSAVRDFGDRIKKGGVGLFFYAGHGLQLEGENYLVPVDADIQRDFDVKDQCISANYVLDAMSYAGNRLNIVILDACRNNPFRSLRAVRGGLAQMNAPPGSLIAFATAPGSVAQDGVSRNGLYTSKLLAYLDQPGVELTNLFNRVGREVMSASQNQQVPWINHSPLPDFFLVPGQAAPAYTSKAPDGLADDRARVEAERQRLAEEQARLEAEKERLKRERTQVASVSSPSYQPNILEAIGGKNIRLRFYESGRGVLPANQRQYSTRFSKGGARFINWEIGLNLEKPLGYRKDFVVHAAYYRPDGSLLAEQDNPGWIESTWKSWSNYMGWGWENPGNWKPGKYIVVLSISGQTVAREFFEIY